MSKTLKNNHYLTEYSASFKWKDQNINGVHRSCVTRRDNIDPLSESTILNERKLHQFRHKLKLALLEKLEKLESEYMVNDSEVFDRSSNISSKQCRKKYAQSKTKIVQAHSPILISDISDIQRNQKQRKLKSKNGVDIEGWRQELQRSRSMALEFKHKNESTQIWWLNESLDSSSEEEDMWFDHPARSPKSNTRSSLLRGPAYVQSRSIKTLSKNPMISTKISTTEPSQSTFSKSSVSYQIAQATGYQSTTDELSSFNHDTDCRSVDPVHIRRKLSNPIPSITNNKEYENAEIIKLVLPVEAAEEDYSTIKRSPLQFYPPYQTEDFNKDTSSDSNIRNSFNNDTYRLD